MTARPPKRNLAISGRIPRALRDAAMSAGAEYARRRGCPEPNFNTILNLALARFVRDHAPERKDDAA